MRAARRTAAADAAAVAAFVVIGRASHHHGETATGFASTAWPFALGLGTGWLLTGRRPPMSLRTGLMVSSTTVAVGMTARVVAGQGTAVAFVIVALCFLTAAMLGGRLLLGGRRSRRPSQPSPKLPPF